MTTSTDSNPAPQKKKKAPGPIRSGALIPALVAIALTFFYFRVFFDAHLRAGLEYALTQVNGAEVNIGRLNTSFLNASLEIRDVQMTDKNQPQRNLFEVGELRFKLLWDALLRAKVVVDDASILNIQALNPRKSPGYVVPPSPPSEGPSMVEKAQDQVLNQTKKMYSENFLGDLAAVLGGTDYKDQLKTLQTNLKSDARVKELEKDLNEKKAKWDKRLKELPRQEEFKQLEARIKALKFNTKNPGEFAKDLKEADQIRKEIEAKIKLIDQSNKEARQDVDAFTTAFKDLEKMIKEDLADLQSRLKLPNIDAKNFSQQLFMAMLEQKLAGYAKYIAVARKYMPPKKSKTKGDGSDVAGGDDQITPRKRGQGQNFHFPITTSYPLFWLKHAAISSELGQSELSGNLKGEINDITTDPAHIGKPAVIKLSGDFPKQNIFGFDSKITLDHTTEQAKDSIDMSVQKYPVGETRLSSSPDVSLALQTATATAQVNAELVDGQLTADLKNTFGDSKFAIEAKNPTVREILDNVLKGIPTVTMNAKVTGSFDNLDVNINSNLGQELASGFKKQLQVKIDQAKAQLDGLIKDKIGPQKDKLKKEMDQILGGLNKQLGDKKSEADKALQQATKQADNKGNPTKQLEQEGKKLLKKFGF